MSECIQATMVTQSLIEELTGEERQQAGLQWVKLQHPEVVLRQNALQCLNAFKKQWLLNPLLKTCQEKRDHQRFILITLSFILTKESTSFHKNKARRCKPPLHKKSHESWKT
jgi:ABC-type taurine transport system ATPase subunit